MGYIERVILVAENDCEKQVIVQAKGHVDVQSMVRSQEELEENQQDILITLEDGLVEKVDKNTETIHRLQKLIISLIFALGGGLATIIYILLEAVL